MYVAIIRENGTNTVTICGRFAHSGFFNTKNINIPCFHINSGRYVHKNKAMQNVRFITSVINTTTILSIFINYCLFTLSIYLKRKVLRRSCAFFFWKSFIVKEVVLNLRIWFHFIFLLPFFSHVLTPSQPFPGLNIKRK